MRLPDQPSGLQHGLSFLIDAEWTPEQALAVYELLDDLRERIWEHYILPIQALLQEQRDTCETYQPNNIDDPPF
jgi:hypothetical protein